MTREEKIDMFCMRMDGYTLQEIGNQYGITREYVRQILDVGKRKDIFQKIVYPGLKQYLVENKMSVRKLSFFNRHSISNSVKRLVRQIKTRHGRNQ